MMTFRKAEINAIIRRGGERHSNSDINRGGTQSLLKQKYRYFTNIKGHFYQPFLSNKFQSFKIDLE